MFSTVLYTVLLEYTVITPFYGKWCASDCRLHNEVEEQWDTAGVMTDKVISDDKCSSLTRQANGRDKSRAEGRDERGAEARQERRPAEFRVMNVEKREPELAGEARSFIGSAQRTSKCAW